MQSQSPVRRPKRRYYVPARQRARLNIAIKTGILPLDRPADRLEEHFCATMRQRGEPFVILRLMRGQWRIALYPDRDLGPAGQWYVRDLLECATDLNAPRGFFGIAPDLALAEPVTGVFRLAENALHLTRALGGR